MDEEIALLVEQATRIFKPIMVKAGCEAEYNKWLENSISKIKSNDATCESILQSQLDNIRLEFQKRSQNN